ncbi:MAG: hypothetical protein WCO12_01880 [bacterium]
MITIERLINSSAIFVGNGVIIKSKGVPYVGVLHIINLRGDNLILDLLWMAEHINVGRMEWGLVGCERDVEIVLPKNGLSLLSRYPYDRITSISLANPSVGIQAVNLYSRRSNFSPQQPQSVS